MPKNQPARGWAAKIMRGEWYNGNNSYPGKSSEKIEDGGQSNQASKWGGK
jgi:hypothetical protein